MRRVDTVFWMQSTARPEAPIWVASILAGANVRRSAFVVDPWRRSLAKIGWLATIQRLDPLFVPFRQAEAELARRFSRGRFEWMPFGVDTDVFKPRQLEKDIDIYWMGRRYEPLHVAIVDYCSKFGLRYIYTENGSIKDPDKLGQLISRSKYFVVTPPDLDDKSRTGGFSPLVMRYMEGLAAGTRLLGVLPTSGEYELLLPIDAILQVNADGSDLAEQLEADKKRTTAAAVARAAEVVRVHHSWARRAQQIFDRLDTGKVAFPMPE
jgi:glycosyltransferase involved in cell wall biosynthesis